MCVEKHAEITQNNKFASFWKKWVMKLIFLHADKHESFLQICIMILVGMMKHSQSSQDSKFVMSFISIKGETVWLRHDQAFSKDSK